MKKLCTKRIYLFLYSIVLFPNIYFTISPVSYTHLKLNGKAVCLPKNTRMNRNIAVYGASGSMKSRAFARNMIFQCVARGASLIITDPKSELYESRCV